MAILQPPLARVVRPMALVLLLTLAACGPRKPPMGQPDAVPVSAVKVEPQRVAVRTELPGRVQAIEDAEIRARVTGIVQAINFDQGSLVKKGQLLFTIDPAPYEAARDQAAANLKNAEATLHSAQLLANRYAKLIKQHAISQQAYDDAVAQAGQAKAAVAGAKAALESAEIDLGYTRVTSPIEGRIGKSMVTVGALVSASSATQMATVQRLNEVYVDVTQSTNELSDLRRRIAKGLLVPDASGDSPAQVVLNDTDVYEHDGKLLFSGVSVNPGTGEVDLRAKFPNPEQILLPGMYVRVRLTQGVDEKALVVPSQAVQRTADGKSTLVVVKDGKAAFTPVQVGPRTEHGYIIYDGLSPGDQVVVEGFQKIRPGAPLKPQPWNPDADAATASGSSPQGAGQAGSKASDNADGAQEHVDGQDGASKDGSSAQG